MSIAKITGAAQKAAKIAVTRAPKQTTNASAQVTAKVNAGAAPVQRQTIYERTRGA